MSSSIVNPQEVILSVKPFLKWAGGKRQLLAQFRELYPPALYQQRIKHYYEPFMGSAAVFFDIVQTCKIEQAHLYDVNEELVLTYRVIQEQVTKLIDSLYRMEKQYLGYNREQRQAYYYKQRELFNEQKKKIKYASFQDQWIKRAAQLIFLNRTCYNGLYRVNASGFFNTPAGDYARPVICDEKNLLSVAKALEIASIQKADFTAISRNFKKDAFVYFDPPYRPLTRTAAFTAYHTNVFGDADQIRLASLFGKLDKKGALLMLSNSDPGNIDPKDDFFERLYQGYTINKVSAKRLINSNASRRGVIKEILVTNYPKT